MSTTAYEKVRVRNVEAIVRDDTVSVDLEYPRIEGHVRRVEVGICCVRAADSILVEYDFDRDGYSIKQASTFTWESGDAVCDPDWQEVAFVPAWGRHKPAPWEDV